MGTIKYISKIITENIGSVKWFSTQGGINFNATKEVILQSKYKIKYDQYASTKQTG